MNFWCHDLHFDDFKSLIARMHGSSSFPTPESSRINASRLMLPPSPDTRRSKSGLLIFQVMKTLLAPFAMKLMLLNVWNALYANFFYPFHT